MERVETGIPGLDELIQGGFVKGSANLLAGTTGTCKTIFGCQFILHGLRRGEACVLVSLEQKVEDILADMAVFGWDKEFRGYMKRKKLVIYREFPPQISRLIPTITTFIDKMRVDRLVLDSLTVAIMGWGEEIKEAMLRRDVFDFISKLRGKEVTSLLIIEIPHGEERISKFGFEEFIVDSVLITRYLEYTLGGIPYSISIRKMRRTDHATDIYPFRVTKDGIAIVKE
jgi:circadian clock protein KaiC